MQTNQQRDLAARRPFLNAKAMQKPPAAEVSCVENKLTDSASSNVMSSRQMKVARNSGESEASSNVSISRKPGGNERIIPELDKPIKKQTVSVTMPHGVVSRGQQQVTGEAAESTSRAGVAVEQLETEIKVESFSERDRTLPAEKCSPLGAAAVSNSASKDTMPIGLAKQSWCASSAPARLSNERQRATFQVASMWDANVPFDFIDLVTKQQVHVGVRVVVPTAVYPHVNFIGKLLGSKGNTLKSIQQRYGTRISILGRGSMKDVREEHLCRNSGAPKYAHLRYDTHVLIEVVGLAADAYEAIGATLRALEPYLTPTSFAYRTNDSHRHTRQAAATYETRRPGPSAMASPNDDSNAAGNMRTALGSDTNTANCNWRRTPNLEDQASNRDRPRSGRCADVTGPVEGVNSFPMQTQEGDACLMAATLSSNSGNNRKSSSPSARLTHSISAGSSCTATVADSDTASAAVSRGRKPPMPTEVSVDANAARAHMQRPTNTTATAPATNNETISLQPPHISMKPAFTTSQMAPATASGVSNQTYAVAVSAANALPNANGGSTTASTTTSTATTMATTTMSVAASRTTAKTPVIGGQATCTSNNSQQRHCARGSAPIASRRASSMRTSNANSTTGASSYCRNVHSVVSNNWSAAHSNQAFSSGSFRNGLDRMTAGCSDPAASQPQSKHQYQGQPFPQSCAQPFMFDAVNGSSAVYPPYPTYAAYPTTAGGCFTQFAPGYGPSTPNYSHPAMAYMTPMVAPAPVATSATTPSNCFGQAQAQAFYTSQSGAYTQPSGVTYLPTFGRTIQPTVAAGEAMGNYAIPGKAHDYDTMIYNQQMMHYSPDPQAYNAAMPYWSAAYTLAMQTDYPPACQPVQTQPQSAQLGGVELEGSPGNGTGTGTPATSGACGGSASVQQSQQVSAASATAGTSTGAVEQQTNAVPNPNPSVAQQLQLCDNVSLSAADGRIGSNAAYAGSQENGWQWQLQQASAPVPNSNPNASRAAPRSNVSGSATSAVSSRN